MSRIPDDELDRLKREVDLAALVRSKGIELKPHGSKDLVGLSPFSEEKTPSFIVTPAKNLWHCMSSGKGGSVVDFVMRYDGVSFRHAVEILREAKGLPRGESPPKLETPVSFDADDQALFTQVLDYYRERLLATPSALAYLEKRGISREAVEAFGIGFADRTLGLRLPTRDSAKGEAIRTRLQKLGLYRASGHEHFNGCIVFPILDGSGNVSEVYGRRIAKQKSRIYHLYLPGPHRGLFNAEAFESPEVILAESVIDALTFWSAGVKNVTCIWGTEGFTGDHLEAFKGKKTRRVFLAYDADKAGNRAAERDASRLCSLGIDCFRVEFPQGHDPNSYALAVAPASKSLPLLLQSAKPLLASRDALRPKETNTRVPSSNEELAANAAQDEEGSAKEIKVEQSGEDVVVRIGERLYRVRGLAKNASLDTLKMNLRVMSEGLFHVDNLDLYQAKQRNGFIVAASEETGLRPDLLKRDLGKVLLALEELQEKRLSEKEDTPDVVELGEAERESALDLLRDPRLLDRILSDFAACGVVGEETNKLAGYLAAVSRKLDRPLAIIIQSTSAAGKTSLMEAVLEMMPEEERIKYSAMTGQSLYYLGESDLKHKILAIVEEEGAEKASYALKLLQSEGELTIAAPSKDENGRLKTEEYRVEGPSAIFLATTAIDVDEELQNRCLILTVDESREQTQAIHGLQRGGDTFDGLKTGIERKRILDTHRNAQRLLRSVHVVNPFAPYLTFPSERTRARRDHTKYLALIRTIALLHQHQRELKRTDGIEYIEVELSDIAAANRIAHEALGRSLDELPPQTRRLLGLLQSMVKERCEKKELESQDCLFTRRDVRERIGWSDTQLKVHLSRLVDMEYLATRCNPRHSQSYLYELLYEGPVEEGGKHLPGLIEIDQLKAEYDANRSGQKPNRSARNANRSAPGRGPVGGRSKSKSDASRSPSGTSEPDAEKGEKDKSGEENEKAS